MKDLAKGILIRKASGEEVIFSEEKLRRSLSKACPDKKIVDQILHTITSKLKAGTSTQEIYREAFDLLESISRPAAGKYKLKRAIMELGPSGYPFERLVGEILKHQGFEVTIGQIVKGYCVNHEIDVIAVKDKNHYMVECKFHNRPGYQCDVKVPLYIQARFEDVQKQWKSMNEHTDKFHQGWLVTNTRFSGDAIQYGKCVGLNLIGWDYPSGGSLNEMIDSFRLYPLTCLTTLSGKEKTILLENKMILCKDLITNENVLGSAGISSRKQVAILKEANALNNTL